jgi:hypothetical protein
MPSWKPLRPAAAALLLAAPLLCAQAPLPVLRVDPAPGGSVFYIRNDYSQSLTAYLVELVDYPGSYYALWADMPEDVPLASGTESRRPIANMTVGAVPDYVKMQAAIYADGSTAGNPEKVAALIERRRAILAAVRELIARAERPRR